MRVLTTTLLEAQKKATAIPYVKVEVTNQLADVVRYDWERLYTGSEDDYYHDAALPGDGSLIRARVTLPSDSQKLYYQRVVNPGAASDFSEWTYTGHYSVVAVAVAALDSEVSIFWIKTNREISRIKSTDYGASWGSPELIDYTPTTNIGGITAAYKPNGDLAIFYADQSTLYIKEYIDDQWQSPAGWGKTTGELTGVTCVYNDDWNLMVTGQDSSGNYKLWSLVYGDGGEVTAGEWSGLFEIATAPSGGDFEFRQPFLDNTDVYRCFFIEKYDGTESFSRPYRSNTVVDTTFPNALWREPIPFNLDSEYGVAISHSGSYAWLSTPNGVWRADTSMQNLDISADVVAVKCEESFTGSRIYLELRNDDGRYSSPGTGDISVLDIGCRIDISPGYMTSAGPEYSPGMAFQLEGYEHISAGGKASIILSASDGWRALRDWKVKNQFRWNKDNQDRNVREILEFILARAGIKLEVISQSGIITNFYPDVTISSSNDGRSILHRLLSYVPDDIFIEGNTAYLINPLPTDGAVYSYGTEHVIFSGRYSLKAQEINYAQVEGYDPATENMVLASSFEWTEIDRLYERAEHSEDRNITTVSEAQERGQTILRDSEIASADGHIIVPANCGQQLMDVIEVTDKRAGLDGQKKRVTGIMLDYRSQLGEYTQRISLGTV